MMSVASFLVLVVATILVPARTSSAAVYQAAGLPPEAWPVDVRQHCMCLEDDAQLVCGTDGETYRSRCALDCAPDVSFLHAGRCGVPASPESSPEMHVTPEDIERLQKCSGDCWATTQMNIQKCKEGDYPCFLRGVKMFLQCQCRCSHTKLQPQHLSWPAAFQTIDCSRESDADLNDAGTPEQDFRRLEDCVVLCRAREQSAIDRCSKGDYTCLMKAVKRDVWCECRCGRSRASRAAKVIAMYQNTAKIDAADDW